MQMCSIDVVDATKGMVRRVRCSAFGNDAMRERMSGHKMLAPGRRSGVTLPTLMPVDGDRDDGSASRFRYYTGFHGEPP